MAGIPHTRDEMQKNCGLNLLRLAAKKRAPLESLSAFRFLRIACFAACFSISAMFLHAAAVTMEKQSNGIAVHVNGGELRIQVLSDTVVRVMFSKSAEFFERRSIDTVPQPSPTTRWTVRESSGNFTLSTAKLRVIVDRESGAVSFADADGHPILAEVGGSRILEPATVQGETTFHLRQKWKAQADESLYGLGQMQLGIADIKGYDLDLWQHNTNVVVPFLVSSKGYGILWDNTSFTRFGDLRPFEPIPAADLYDANSKPGGPS
jgi:alpha-D-xyloside xylohydrolase